MPHGYVAVLDDDAQLNRVFAELLEYALEGSVDGRRRLGVVFRQVTGRDRAGVGHKLVEHFGAPAFLELASVYGIDESYCYVIDSEALAHAWHRHGDQTAEELQGQTALIADDLNGITDVVRPINIQEFSVVKSVPRIVYESVVARGLMRVVLEVQHGRKCLVVRTVYLRR